jgi:hypothetical protein
MSEGRSGRSVSLDVGSGGYGRSVVGHHRYGKKVVERGGGMGGEKKE